MIPWQPQHSKKSCQASNQQFRAQESEPAGGISSHNCILCRQLGSVQLEEGKGICLNSQRSGATQRVLSQGPCPANVTELELKCSGYTLLPLANQ